MASVLLFSEMGKNFAYLSLTILTLLGIILTIILIGRARNFEERVRKYDSVYDTQITYCYV
ncbi:MAG: hypothetical protein U9M98_03435 [Patescibacteria group bacterium]|nr:hypothetical protein [Patescibacteria group bacterium]